MKHINFFLGRKRGLFGWGQKVYVVKVDVLFLSLKQPKGPFRTKSSTAPESVVFCYRRSFSLSVPFSRSCCLEKQAFLSPLRSVFLRPYRIFSQYRNSSRPDPCSVDFGRETPKFRFEFCHGFFGGFFSAVFSKEKGPKKSTKKSPAKFTQDFVQKSSPWISAEAFSWKFTLRSIFSTGGSLKQSVLGRHDAWLLNLKVPFVCKLRACKSWPSWVAIVGWMCSTSSFALWPCWPHGTWAGPEPPFPKGPFRTQNSTESEFRYGEQIPYGRSKTLRRGLRSACFFF